MKFLAEKATKRMFEPIAFVKYDEAVRDRVNDKGVSQFGVIETNVVYSHFSLENTTKVTGKGFNYRKRWVWHSPFEQCQQGRNTLHSLQ